MEEYLYVLLYSKFSKSSTEILRLLEEYNMITTMNIHTLCIDNEDIRNRILNSIKIEIRIVPCLLIVYKTGAVEKYEAIQAFEWVREIIRKNQEAMQKMIMLQNQKIELEQPVKPVQKHIKTKIQNPVESSVINEKLQSSSKKKKNKKQSTKVYTQKERKNTKKIQELKDMEDLDEVIDDIENINDVIESENENSDSENELNFPRPPVAIMDNKGAYDITNDFGKPLEENRKTTKNTKKTTQPTKTVDLMSTAMAMQKEREKLDSGNRARPQN